MYRLRKAPDKGRKCRKTRSLSTITSKKIYQIIPGTARLFIRFIRKQKYISPDGAERNRGPDNLLQSGVEIVLDGKPIATFALALIQKRVSPLHQAIYCVILARLGHADRHSDFYVFSFHGDT